MRLLVKHVTKCLLAGIVALLPIAGLVLGVGYLESMISSAGLTALPFVFVPGSPNPTSGRLLVTSPDEVRPVDMPVNAALKVLVAVGKTDLRLD
ncbi:MAG: hypothetical protein HKP57_05340 [Halobacteria archaeon]|nr:hypothetical protein [Halobacteria archaeon]